MSEFPEKIQQSEKYPDEDCSVVLGNCYDKKMTGELVKRWNCHKDLVKACQDVQLELSLLWKLAKLEPNEEFKKIKVATVESRIKQVIAALTAAKA